MDCLLCGKDTNQKTIRVKNYCNILCRAKYNMRKRYLIIKDDPEYKNLAKIRSMNWYQRNKERHQKYMREYMRKIYLKRKENETKIL